MDTRKATCAGAGSPRTEAGDKGAVIRGSVAPRACRLCQERSLQLVLFSDGSTRKAVTGQCEEGMDSTSGSGHRPTVAVGTTMYSWENRAV